MTADLNPDIAQIKNRENFDALQQMKLFQALKKNRFSGQLCLKSVRDLEWIFFLYLGRIIYATGGQHTVRRWRRNLTTYFPQIAQQLQQELQEVKIDSYEEIVLTWDYYLLNLWVKQQKINLEQITKNIRALTSEILFDITQEKKVSFNLITEQDQSFQPLAMIDSEQEITRTEKLSQQWQDLDLIGTLSNLAPKIINPHVLRENTSEKTYQIITRLLDSRHSIRDLAVQKKSDDLTLLRSILPYIQIGAIDFVEIPDIAYPIAIPENFSSKQLHTNTIAKERKLLIAYVVANPIMNRLIKKVVTVVDYDFMIESNPMRAMPLLLDKRPDMIFLDIELPNLNAYEMCTRLRQLDYFKNSPIILFGRNITLVERMKAKMAGASELFQQSMNVKFLIELVQKYAVSLTGIS